MSSTNDFSFDTIKDFDDHIRLSIPNYDTLAESIVSMSQYFVVDNTGVVDIGCSTGKLLESIAHNGQKIGVDVSSNLLPESHDNTIYEQKDLRYFDSYKPSSLVLSVFTLQFMDRADRLDVVKRVHDGLIDGGAFIMAEKVIDNNGSTQDIMNFTHYDYKLKSFTSEEILSKEKSLRKIMRCNTSQDNQRLVQNAGFKRGHLFWKYLNFEAWLWVKEQA